MTNNLEMILKNLRKRVIDEYSQKLVELTLHYQKKYGFELNTKYGHDHSTWNSEADAFKHVFGSALIAMEKGNFYSVVVGSAHEYEYLMNSKKYKNPKAEKRMDLHNNKIGRNIANELVKDYAGRWDNLSQQEKEDIIADRVWKHMQAGNVILDPTGRTKLKGIGVNNSQNGQNTNKKSETNAAEKSACVGSYSVSGYTRADGTEVKGYTRTCGAKHSGMSREERLAGQEKYRGKKFQDIPQNELEEAISFFI